MARLIGCHAGNFVEYSDVDFPTNKMSIKSTGITPQPGDYFSVDLSPDYAPKKLADLGLELGLRDNTNTRKGFCLIGLRR